MKKRTILAALLLVSIMVLLCGCGKQAPSAEEMPAVNPEPTETVEEAITETADAAPEVEKEEAAPEELEEPAEAVDQNGETEAPASEEAEGQEAEEAADEPENAAADEQDATSGDIVEETPAAPGRTIEITVPAEYADVRYRAGEVTWHEDDSVTYHLTEEEHEQLLGEVHSDIQRELNEMCASPYFLDFFSINANEDCSVFTVVCLSIETTMAEQESPRQLYEMGRRYAAYQGREAGSIRLDYMNKIGNTFTYRNSEWDRLAKD